jgi:hypothetical protein
MSFTGSAGAAAGAFIGDNERKAQQQRDQQLALQAASLNQQAQQSEMADRRYREGLGLQENARKENLEFEKTQLQEKRSMFNTQTERQKAADAESTRQFDITNKRAVAQEERLKKSTDFEMEMKRKSSEWDNVLNEEKRKKFELEYGEFKKIADEANLARENKAKTLESWTGKLIKMALEGGPVAPEALEVFNKETGGTIQQAYPDGLGGVVVKKLTKDPQSGQQVLADVRIDPDMVKTVKKSLGMADASDESMFALQSKNDMALQREEVRAKASADRYNSQAEARGMSTVDRISAKQISDLMTEKMGDLSMLEEVLKNPKENAASKKQAQEEYNSLSKEIEGLDLKLTDMRNSYGNGSASSQKSSAQPAQQSQKPAAPVGTEGTFRDPKSGRMFRGRRTKDGIELIGWLK